MSLLLSTFMFISCDKEEDKLKTDIHDHTYSDEWSYNETHHYHKATCEHKYEKKDEAVHTFDEGVVTKEATEEVEGEKKYTCSICGYEKTESTGKLPHTHTFSSEWSYNETHHYHKATCEHSDEKKDEAVHTFNEGVVTKEATEEVEGEKKYTCSICGYEKTEAIDKLPHTHKFSSEWSYNDTYHYHEATCEHSEEKGSYGEHTYVDHVCSECGKVNETTLYSALLNLIPKSREDIKTNSKITTISRSAQSYSIDFTNSNLTNAEQQNIISILPEGDVYECKNLYAYREDNGGEAYEIRYVKENGEYNKSSAIYYFKSGENYYKYYDEYTQSAYYVSEGHAQYSLVDVANEEFIFLSEAPANYSKYAEFLSNWLTSEMEGLNLNPEDVETSFVVENNKYKFVIHFVTISDSVRLEYNIEIIFTNDGIETSNALITMNMYQQQKDETGDGYSVMTMTSNNEYTIEFATGFTQELMNKDISSVTEEIGYYNIYKKAYINGSVNINSYTAYNEEFNPTVAAIPGLEWYLDEDCTIKVTEPVVKKSYEEVKLYAKVDGVPEGYAEVITVERGNSYTEIDYYAAGSVPSHSYLTAYVCVNGEETPSIITDDPIQIVAGNRYYIRYDE